MKTKKLNILKFKKVKAAGLLVAVLTITSLSIIGVMLVKGIDYSIKNVDNFNIKSQTFNISEAKLNDVIYSWNSTPIESNISSDNYKTNIYNWPIDANISNFEQIGEIQLNNLEGESIDITTTNKGHNRRMVYKINTVGKIPNSNIQTILETILTYNYQ